MSVLAAVGRFWWSFVVGDDWRVAAAVVIALVLTDGLVRAGAPAWWLLPLAVCAGLAQTVRAARRP